MRLLFVLVSFFYLIGCSNNSEIQEKKEELVAEPSILGASESLNSLEDKKDSYDEIAEEDRIYLYGKYYYNQPKQIDIEYSATLIVNGGSVKYYLHPYYIEDKLKSLEMFAKYPHKLSDLRNLYSEKYGEGSEKIIRGKKTNCVMIPSIESINNSYGRNISSYKKINYTHMFPASGKINDEGTEVDLTGDKLSIIPHYDCVSFESTLKFDKSSYHIHLINKASRAETIFNVTPKFTEKCRISDVTLISWAKDNKMVSIEWTEYKNYEELSKTVYPIGRSQFANECTITYTVRQPKDKTLIETDSIKERELEKQSQKTKENI
jgi:hypothetical protein